MKGKVLKYPAAILITIMLSIGTIQAREYVIFSIAQDIPMGYEQQQRRKNYYVNIGKLQGVRPETRLEVFRTISRLDPYQDRKRHRFTIKIGELKVIHSQQESSIAVLESVVDDFHRPYTEIGTVMIGDTVAVKID